MKWMGWIVALLLAIGLGYSRWQLKLQSDRLSWQIDHQELVIDYFLIVSHPKVPADEVLRHRDKYLPVWLQRPSTRMHTKGFWQYY